MNELQLALLGAGVLAILAVWIYNAVQERTYRKRAEAIFKGAQADVLASPPGIIVAPALTGEPLPGSPAQRREPVALPPDAAADRAAQAHEPEHGTGHQLDVPASPPTASAAGDDGPAAREQGGPDDLLPWADPLTDCLVRLSAPDQVSGDVVWAAQGQWRDGIGKRINWLARIDERNPWEPVAAPSATRYGQWLAALQMVDRAGAVSDVELAHFLDGVRRIGQLMAATTELPDAAEMLTRARELDRFCASVDVQFSVSVVSSQGNVFAGTKLRGVCEAAGLALDADGRYHYRNAAGECEFSLANLGKEPFDASAMSSLVTHGVSLTIDVPRVSDGTAAFNRLIQVARQLAQGLGGAVVDANRAPLADSVIATIRGKIGEVQHVLDRAGIIAGSARAMRLFS